MVEVKEVEKPRDETLASSIVKEQLVAPPGRMPSQVNVSRAQKADSDLFQGMLALVSIPTIQSISLGLKGSQLYREDLDGRGVSGLKTPKGPFSLVPYLHPEIIKVFHPPFIQGK